MKSIMKNINNAIAIAVKSVLTLLVCMVLLGSCKKSPKTAASFMVTNNSGEQLVLVGVKDGERIVIGSGQSRDIPGELSAGRFTIEGPAGSALTYEFEPSGNRKYTIIGYVGIVEYKVLGQDAALARITYDDDQGNRISLPAEKLPFHFPFKTFAAKRYHLSAENLSGKGFLTIQVLFKGRIRSELSAPQNVAFSGNLVETP